MSDREHPFKLGQKVTCIDADWCEGLIYGKDYIIHELRWSDNTPMACLIGKDGFPRKYYARRFRSLPTHNKYLVGTAGMYGELILCKTWEEVQKACEMYEGICIYKAIGSSIVKVRTTTVLKEVIEED